MLEREVKLSFPTAESARQAVLALGLTESAARRLQDDSLFDTPDETLRTKGCVLRVRSERWSDGRATTTLTVKGPVQAGAMKIREEHETRVEDGEALAQVLATLGLRPWFRYHKYRQEFRADDLVVAIDESPVGTFVELEGAEPAILQMAAALGSSPADFILDSYYRLFQARREQYGLTGTDMLFVAPPPGDGHT